MRKLTYTTEFGGDYSEVSISLLEEESEKILGIRIGPMDPFYLRDDDIDELHDKIHECLEARETFAKLAAQGMGGWDEQPDESDLHGVDLAILRGLDEQGEADTQLKKES